MNPCFEQKKDGSIKPENFQYLKTFTSSFPSDSSTAKIK